MQRDLIVAILYDSIYNQNEIVKMWKLQISGIISVGNNFVFIYILLSLGVWWHVGNTKLLKRKT